MNRKDKPPGAATRASNLLRRLRSRGPVATLRFLGHHLSERYNDARYGIHTTGKITPAELGIDNPLCKIYAPSAYRSFRAALARVELRPGRDVFLDLGAGKGRVLCLAAMQPFRRVLGVEISSVLAEQARENLRRADRFLRCREVEVRVADAAGFALPDEVTVLHLFDPFKGEILEKVVENLRASLARAPRAVTILYADPNHFDPLAERLPWITRLADVPYPYQEGGDPIRHMYRIYRAEL